MEVSHKVYECAPTLITIEVPEGMTGRPLEVILQPLDRETDLYALALELGLNPAEIQDWHALKFAGCMPDFPPRAPQGEYEERMPFDWE